VVNIEVEEYLMPGVSVETNKFDILFWLSQMDLLVATMPAMQTCPSEISI
jgi:hypothetical protein